MFKKLLALFAVAALSVACLAGCGPTTPDNPGGGGGNPAATTAMSYYWYEGGGAAPTIERLVFNADGTGTFGWFSPISSGWANQFNFTYTADSLNYYGVITDFNSNASVTEDDVADYPNFTANFHGADAINVPIFDGISSGHAYFFENSLEAGTYICDSPSTDTSIKAWQIVVDPATCTMTFSQQLTSMSTVKDVLVYCIDAGGFHAVGRKFVFGANMAVPDGNGNLQISIADAPPPSSTGASYGYYNFVRQ